MAIRGNFMPPDPGGFVQSLVDYAQQIDDVTPLEEWRDSLWTKMQAGDGKAMVTSSPGGKIFEFEITITVEELFRCVVAAIKAFNHEGGDSPVTFPDFSQTDFSRPPSTLL